MVCKKIHFEEGRPDNNNNINNNYSATYGIVPLLFHYQIYIFDSSDYGFNIKINKKLESYFLTGVIPKKLKQHLKVLSIT
jgi:hypothetical protein